MNQTIPRNIHVLDTETITVENMLSQWDTACIVDVRSPAEHAAGSIPKSLNINLFSDLERKDIGILWKNFGDQKALNYGYELLDKSHELILAEFNRLPETEPIFIYCARGGLRSKMACNLATLTGRRPIQIRGGYKQFRNFTLEFLQALSGLHIVSLNGLAGSGKTQILQYLSNSIDLEGCAGHSGSAFGHINNSPASMKDFEGNLLRASIFLDRSLPVFVEAESRRVGGLSIPDALWDNMKSSKQIVVECSLETRVRRMIERYCACGNPENRQQILNAFGKLQKFFSADLRQTLRSYISNERYEEFWEAVLTMHYDRKYMKSIKQKKSLFYVSGEDPKSAANEIVTRVFFRNTYAGGITAR